MKHYYKKALALVGAALLLGGGVATAQERWQFGVGAEAKLNTLTPKEWHNVMFRPGIDVSGIVRFSMSEHWFAESRLSVGLNYFNSGKVYDPSGCPNYRYISLGLPVMAGYRGNISETKSAYIMAGPTFNYTPWAQMKFEIDKSWTYYKIDGLYHWNIGAMVRGGILFGNRHRVELGYSINLTHMAAETDSRLHSISLGYAYMF